MPAFSPAQKGLVYAKVETAENTAIYASQRFRRQLGAPRQRAGAADVLREHPSRSEGRRAPLRADRADAGLRDGGRTFRGVGERSKHVDNHYVWIDPDNTDHLLEGCDGGLYESGIAAGCGGTSPTCR